MSLHKTKRIKLIAACSLHSVLLTVITLLLLEMNYTYGDERLIIKWSTVIKKVVLGIDNKPSKDKILFINTSYDNMLIDRLDADGFTIGNQVITDREKLSRLFEIVRKGNSGHRYILCDIFFKDVSPFDSSLNENIKNLKNIIIPYHLGENNIIEEPVFKINKGFSDYNVIEGSFLKYSLMQNDSLQSLPLKMYEDVYGAEFKNSSLISRMNGAPSFNTIIIDFKIRDYDIREEKSENTYPYVNLGEFIELPDSVVLETMRNRLVVIGDFQEKDLHQTIIGPMHGGMILLNVFLSVENSENIIKPFFLLILFVVYFLISVDIFSDKNIKDRKYVKKLTGHKFGKFLLKLLEYLFYLMATSIIIYIFYNIHINILIIALYLKFLDSLITKVRALNSGSEKPRGIKNNAMAFIKIIPKLFKPQS